MKAEARNKWLGEVIGVQALRIKFFYSIYVFYNFIYKHHANIKKSA